MTTYRYKGQTKDGTAVSGVIRAYDEFEAASRLRETVAVITRLEEVREKKENIFNRPIGLKIKEKELALICSQFAIILSAGMSIQHCVEMVAAQTRNRHIRQMLEKVAEEVGAGYSMAQSFENNAPYLPKTFVETVRAGEQSGTLEECFQRLHRYYDKSAKTKAKVVSTLTYPAMVIVVAIVVFIIIIAVAVPAFNDVFAEMDTQLPGITRVLLAISDFFVGWWWLLLLIAAGLGIAYMVARRSIRGRRAIAAWSLTKAPLHRLHSLSAAAQFAHSMATMLTAGLPVPKASKFAIRDFNKAHFHLSFYLFFTTFDKPVPTTINTIRLTTDFKSSPGADASPNGQLPYKIPPNKTYPAVINSSVTTAPARTRTDITGFLETLF